jgi:hypothetical protein
MPRLLPDVQDRHVFACRAYRCGTREYCLAFPADQSDESSCAIEARERIRKTNMTIAETTNTAATVGEQGATVAPEKAPSKKRAGQGKGAPKGQKAAKGGKTKVAPKEEAKTSKKAAKPTRAKEASTPHPESKGAKILELIGRPKGATLAEIMKTTTWQAHSVRGFLSTAAKKNHLQIQSSKNDAGDRIYKIVK